ncbi:MAG: glycoside hydrolase family 16 protein [Bacteroidales bacterium]|jgi:beta-glucanase (GH16 family)|nr:glycoside hydrolase family 16 protein [Bacteroidales bacterium]
MKKLLLLMLVLTACGRTAEPGWELAWSDEFNNPGLPDSANWVNEVGFIRNHELQYYTERRIENTIIDDGHLLIIGRKEKYDTAEYTSASLTTEGLHNWRYGRIEARMKLPKGQGLWPAFWMLGENIREVGWPRCGEIDIMEHINNEDFTYGTLHWHNEKHVSSGTRIPCMVDQFHTYMVEWDSDSLRWFLDGTRFHGVCIKDSVNSTHEFHLPHYIILNMAIGGDWPKNPDETTVFPDTVFVDYVRVWQK